MTFNGVAALLLSFTLASFAQEFRGAISGSLELRGELYSVPNHPVFAAPNTTATNSAFGTIAATVNRFRTLQVSGRIVF